MQNEVPPFLFTCNKMDVTMLTKLTAALVMATAALGATAQTGTDINASTPHSAYAQDSRGTVVRTPFGLCVRSGYWSAADSVIGCDGVLAAPVAKMTAPPPAPSTAPAAIAAAPVAPAAPVVTPRRCDATVTVGADDAFAFNKATLTTAAKRRLDADLLPKIAACSKLDLLIVTGHSDRIGSDSANRKLSEKRASAVIAHLRARGVDAPIEMLGAGKTQPVKSCSNTLPRTKLIECLAPNRRVVVEIRGNGK